MLDITKDQANTIIDALELAVDELSDRMSTDQRSMYPLFVEMDLEEFEARQKDMIELSRVVANYIKHGE